MKSKFFGLILLALTLMLFGCSTNANKESEESYPSKNIKLIVHTSAGGPTDLMAREVAKSIEEITGTTVVVENKPGGSGATAMAEVYNAEPDGYTFGAMTPSQIGLLNGTLEGQYTIDDFTWISRSQIDPYVIVTHANSSFNSIEDVVEYLKDNPNSLNVGGYGANGSGHNIAWNIFSEAAGIEAEWTPYESTGDAVTALLGQHIDIANSNPGQVSQYVESGELQILAVMFDERLDDFPDVPTLTELGYEVDTDWVQFRGIFGPKDIPDEILAELDQILEKTYSSESYEKYLKNTYLVEGSMDHEEYTEYIRNQDKLTDEWYNKLGVK